MHGQPIKLLLVKIELLTKTLFLQCLSKLRIVTHTNWDKQCRGYLIVYIVGEHGRIKQTGKPKLGLSAKLIPLHKCFWKMQYVGIFVNRSGSGAVKIYVMRDEGLAIL